MPLFFVLSGYFFKEKDTKTIVKKGFKGLIIPYLVTGLIILILKLIPAILKKKDALGVLSKWTEMIVFGSGLKIGINPFTNGTIEPIGAIWFLLSLFFARIILNYVLKIKNKKIQILSLLVISMVGFILPNYIWLPFSLETSFITVLFLYVGYQFKQTGILEKTIPIAAKLIMLLIWIFIILQPKIYCVSNEYNLTYISILGSICGVYFIIELSKIIAKHTEKIKNFLLYSGRNTLKMLCIHIVDIDCIPWDILGGNLGLIFIIRLIFIFINTAILNKLKLAYENLKIQKT